MEKDQQVATLGQQAHNAMDTNISEKYIDILVQYGVQVIAALIILALGLWLANRIKSFLITTLNRQEVDPTLVGFFSSILHGALIVFIVTAAISRLGVQTSSIVAVIGAAGLAVGLALQGSLSNFASGVLLIIFKPFVTGNFIKAGGEAGTVVEIGILSTELVTPDNVKIIIPNSQVMSGSINNFSAHSTRRVDMVLGVSYGDDLEKVKQIIHKLLAADERVLEDPEPIVAVSNLGDSSVDFVVRPWVQTDDYWAFKYEFIQSMKEACDDEGVSIPFPQRDLHLYQESTL